MWHFWIRTELAIHHLYKSCQGYIGQGEGYGEGEITYQSQINREKNSSKEIDKEIKEQWKRHSEILKTTYYLQGVSEITDNGVNLYRIYIYTDEVFSYI